MFFVAMNYATAAYMAFGPINPSLARHPYQAFVRRCIYVSTLWPSKNKHMRRRQKENNSRVLADRQRQNYAWL